MSKLSLDCVGCDDLVDVSIGQLKRKLEADNGHDDEYIIPKPFAVSKPFISLVRFLLFELLVSEVLYKLLWKGKGAPFHSDESVSLTWTN